MWRQRGGATKLWSMVAGVAVLGIALVGCAGTPEKPAQSPSKDPTIEVMPSEEEITETISKFLEETGVPGAAVIITDAEGEEYSGMFGDAAIDEGMSTQNRFGYRSITKSFTGTVILQLVDEGKLKLDDPVSKYVEGVPNGDKITVRELGDMRSGLANYSANPKLGSMLSKDPARDPAVSELLELSFSEPASFAPGKKYEYSNTTTLLLGEVIAKVTGNPWEEEVATRILTPLKLGSVENGFVDPELDATGYEIADGKVVEALPVVAPGWFGAAGALTGTAKNLATWGRALGSGLLPDGKPLLEKATQKERLDQLGSTEEDPNSPEYSRYGFAMGEIDGWVGHTGTGLGFQGLVMYDAKSERVVAILTNATGEDPDLPAHLFKEILALY